MKIVPAAIEEHINRIDRTPSLLIGISLVSVVLFCLYRVLWGFYVAMTFGFYVGPLVFGCVVWGAVGVVAAIGAAGFLTRYAKQP